MCWLDVVLIGRLTPVSPESGDLLVWDQDTTECDQNCKSQLHFLISRIYDLDGPFRLTGDKERVDKCRKDGVGSIGGNKLSDTSVQEFVKGHLEVYRSSDRRRETEPDNWVPRQG